MTADTQYVLRRKLDLQIGPRQAGTFGIVNQDASREVHITLQTIGSGPQGDTFYIRKQGETLTIDRAYLIGATISAHDPTTKAESYPATILLVDTDLTASVTSIAAAIAAGV